MSILPTFATAENTHQDLIEISVYSLRDGLSVNPAADNAFAMVVAEGASGSQMTIDMEMALSPFRANRAEAAFVRVPDGTCDPSRRESEVQMKAASRPFTPPICIVWGPLADKVYSMSTTMSGLPMESGFEQWLSARLARTALSPGIHHQY